jgi:hypothetical protein
MRGTMPAAAQNPLKHFIQVLADCGFSAFLEAAELQDG